MAFATKYQWTISGRERTWLIELQQEGFVPDAPSADDGTIFFTVSASSNTKITANSVMRRNPDGGVTTLVTHASAPGDITHDPTARRLYYGLGDQIRSCFYDGTDDTLVLDHGSGEVLGIEFMPTGTAAGYIYWVFKNASNEYRVRRVFKDGTGSEQVSTGTFEGTGGIRRYSDSLLYCNGGYITTSVFSVGITPTNIPAVVNANNGANSDTGIVIDTANDAVFVNQGLAGSTNLERYDPPDAASSTEFNSVVGGSGGYMSYDAANARILIPGIGLKYRTTASPNTDVTITPATGGSGPTANYTVISALALQ
jgi:hypothetical protein